MIRMVILLLVILTCSLYFMQHSVTILFLDHEVVMPFSIFVFLILVTSTVLAYTFRLVYYVMSIPSNIRTSLSKKRSEKSYGLLYESIISIGNHDISALSSITRKRSLPAPCKQVLKGWIYMMESDSSKLHNIGVAMIGDANLYAAGRIYMIESFLMDEKYLSAFDYSVSLLVHNSSRFSVYLCVRCAAYNGSLWEIFASGDVGGILQNILPSAAFERMYYVGAYQHLKKLMADEKVGEAKALVLKLEYGICPLFDHIALEVLCSAGLMDKVWDAIQKIWSKRPNYITASQAMSLASTCSAEAFFKKVKSITKGKMEDLESKFLLAKAALGASLLDLAHEYIADLLYDEQSVRTCLLMAELCYLSDQSSEEVHQWLLNALNARYDTPDISFYIELNEFNIVTRPTDRSVLVATLSVTNYF